jgi:type II restriction/modification system DNA methylase subunit YeeA
MTIYEAWSDEPWILDGAAVRVSLVCFGRDVAGPYRLDGREVARINPDLTSAAADLTTARRLANNESLSFQGTIKVGPFDIPAETARQWLREPSNANGRPNSDVVKPWRNGLHILRRAEDAWVIDFGNEMTEAEASYYAKPFAHALAEVKPMRDQVRRDNHRRNWWRHGEARPGMRRALLPLTRYVATPRVAKHRVFAWLPAAVVPDCQLVVIARDDDTTLGILHSRFHEAWALRLGTSLEDRPRYTPTTAFETFAFPDGLTPNLPASAYAADPRAIAIAEAARALIEARERWLNPPDLVERVPEVVPGFPDRLVPRNAAAAKALKARTLTNLYNTRGASEGAWLDGLHRALDEAVARAYGWPPDISTEDALAALLALNLARTAR